MERMGEDQQAQNYGQFSSEIFDNTVPAGGTDIKVYKSSSQQYGMSD